MLQKSFAIKLKFYKQFQKNFDKVNLLIYYNFTRVTYIDVNVFKQRSFKIIIYYLKFDANINNFKQKKIELIMFFNRMFTLIKKRY